jgi:hypothetical protein
MSFSWTPYPGIIVRAFACSRSVGSWFVMWTLGALYLPNATRAQALPNWSLSKEVGEGAVSASAWSLASPNNRTGT